MHKITTEVLPWKMSPGQSSGGVLDVWLSVAAELSAIARYYDHTIELPGAEAQGPSLLDAINCPARLAVASVDELPDLRRELTKRTLVVVNRCQTSDADVEKMLAELRPRVGRTTRVALVSRGGEAPRSFPGWTIVRWRRVGYLSRSMGGLGPLANRWLPVLPVCCASGHFMVTILRATVAEAAHQRPSISIIVPARNERANIAHALRRLPDLGGAEIEVIFVEGHSTDGTWTEIERVVAEHATVAHRLRHSAAGEAKSAGKVRVLALRQSGCGKADAVRIGFAAASGDLLTILDADLTMPPEALTEFYEAYCQGRGDFINGDRLTLPMERGAMRPLNKLGNRFFAWAVSRVTDMPLGDCLCGTKLFARHDYQRFAAWRTDFDQRDPFGDFDLLFPAAALALGFVDVQVRYAARTYGRTNIRRFRDGARLLAMTLAGWWRLKTGKTLDRRPS